jgi:hypothetical protein
VAGTRRYFFDLWSHGEIDVLTAVFDRVLANLDCGGGDQGRDNRQAGQITRS